MRQIIIVGVTDSKLALESERERGVERRTGKVKKQRDRSRETETDRDRERQRERERGTKRDLYRKNTANVAGDIRSKIAQGHEQSEECGLPSWWTEFGS
jgi:protein subunit release factor B